MHFYLTKVTPHIKMPACNLYNSDKTALWLRVFVHSCLINPANQCYYWYLNGFFKHRGSHKEGLATFKSKVVEGNCLEYAFCFWMPVSVALYTVVPMHMGNLMLDTCGLVWAVCLSYLGTT